MSVLESVRTTLQYNSSINKQIFEFHRQQRYQAVASLIQSTIKSSKSKINIYKKVHNSVFIDASTTSAAALITIPNNTTYLQRFLIPASTSSFQAESNDIITFLT